MKTQKIQYLIYGLLVLSILTFYQTCSQRSRIKKLEKGIGAYVNHTNDKIDSLHSVIITKDQLIKIIKETPAWKTLRIEEISDKERISINALEQKETN